MKNSNNGSPCFRSRDSKSMYLKIKLSLAFAFLILLQVSANDSLSQKKMVFDLHDVTLKTVLNKIKSQSGYKFFYNVNVVKDQQMLSISAKKENIRQVMVKMANILPIDYYINEQQVVLTPKILAPPVIIEQQQEVTGKVIDKDGTPLPGANVLVKGTSIGAQTDFDGILRLKCPAGRAYWKSPL